MRLRLHEVGAVLTGRPAGAVPSLLLANALLPDRAGRLAPGSLLCECGKVAAIGGPGEPLGPCEGVVSIDLGGLLVLPGFIDAHVHLRQPGAGRKEGVANGSRAALAGGITSLVEMPNTRPPVTTLARLDSKRALFARECLTNWRLLMQATGRPRQPFAPVAAGLKLYLARSSRLGAVTEPEAVRNALTGAPLVALHAEHEGSFLPGGSAPHHEQRPVAAVAAALAVVERELLALPGELRPRLVLCHATGRTELAWVRRMKARGIDLWCESCPHYLLLDQEDYHARGPELQVNPPLRTAADRLALLEALGDGSIDFISTDHAPHLPAEKRSAQPPSGMPGSEWLGPVLASMAVEGKLPWRRVIELGSARQADCYGLGQRGTLAPGAPADLTCLELLERPEPLLAAGSRTLTRAGYCPYPDLPVWARVRATVVGGRLKYLDGAYPDSTPGEELS